MVLKNSFANDFITSPITGFAGWVLDSDFLQAGTKTREQNTIVRSNNVELAKQLVGLGSSIIGLKVSEDARAVNAKAPGAAGTEDT
jgi:hypothetical protein